MKRYGMLLGVALAAGSALPASAAPLSAQAWPECRALKPGASYQAVTASLGGRGRRTGFAIVDELPVATYAFRRASRICRVQIEEGMLLASPSLK